MNIEVGKDYRVEFPFVMTVYSGYDVVDGPFEDDCWKPGCKVELVMPDDSEYVADGIGEMVLTVVDVHKPGKYPERVFYTRKWIDPDGNEFGATKLHITTTLTFKRRAAGYYHDYRVL